MFDGVVEARGVEAGIVMPILKQARPILASRRRYILSSGAVRVCRRAKVRSTTTVSGAALLAAFVKISTPCSGLCKPRPLPADRIRLGISFKGAVAPAEPPMTIISRLLVKPASQSRLR